MIVSPRLKLRAFRPRAEWSNRRAVHFTAVGALTKRCLVLVLVGGLVPGLIETTENLWHLATAGHTAHAASQGADHEPAGDEHGCTGTFHLCSCHYTLASDLVPAPSGPGPGQPRRDLRPPEPEGFLEPAIPGPDHPPRV